MSRIATMAIMLMLMQPGATSAAPGAPGPTMRTFADCDALVSSEPRNLNGYWCYLVVGGNIGRSDQAAARLQTLAAADTTNPRPLLYLAVAAASRGDPAAERLYREAAEGMERETELTGAVRARTSLAFLLQTQGRITEAAAEVAAARQTADSSGSRPLICFARIWQAKQAYLENDYGRAAALFHESEDEVFPDGPAEHQSLILDGLGAVALALGRDREAYDAYRRLAEMHNRTGNHYEEASALHNMALVISRPGMADSDPDDRMRLQERAIEAARLGGNQGIESRLLLALAQEERVAHEQRLAYAEQALAISRRLKQFDSTCFALRLLALYHSRWDRAGGPAYRASLDEAMSLARSRGSLHHIARAHLVESLIAFEAGNRTVATEQGLEALEVIERIRDLQPEGKVRSGVFSEWAYAYRRLSGSLLVTAAGDISSEDLELAFNVSERRRARTLLELLDSAGVQVLWSKSEPIGRRREEVLNKISSAQRRLLGASLSDEGREDALSTLARLEEQEAVLRDEFARSVAPYAVLHRPEIPTVDEVQGALAQDEALLIFQVANRDPGGVGDGGSWVFVISADRKLALPLPDRDELEMTVQAFLGLIARHDGIEARAGSALYQSLLAASLSALRPSVKRLVIVPDEILNRLPFGALRPTARAAPLAAQYELSITPSATLWMRWRRAVAGTGSIPVLAFADPERAGLSGAVEGLPTRRGVGDSIFAPLPGARREARAFVSQAGGGSLLLAGTDATEAALKTADLPSYCVLHLAAHTLIDDAHPDRSAIVLTSGGRGEDGLLQVREIVELDLRDKLIVLSGCSSATGTFIEGEGPLGLARAFFQAGARAVIGGLWPLRDDEAARLVSSLTFHLARGLSAQAALAEAQREMIHDGSPAGAWAAMIVMGDGRMVPLPGGRPPTPILPFLFALALLALIPVVLVVTSRLLKNSRRPRSRGLRTEDKE